MSITEFTNLITHLYPLFNLKNIRYAYRVYKETYNRINDLKSCSVFEKILDEAKERENFKRKMFDFGFASAIIIDTALIAIELAVIDSDFYGKFPKKN